MFSIDIFICIPFSCQKWVFFGNNLTIKESCQHWILKCESWYFQIAAQIWILLVHMLKTKKNIIQKSKDNSFIQKRARRLSCWNMQVTQLLSIRWDCKISLREKTKEKSEKEMKKGEKEKAQPIQNAIHHHAYL